MSSPKRYCIHSLPTVITSVSIIPSQITPADCELDVSQILDLQRVFRTRQVVIRYLDEVHELNDGVHWRLTAQNVDVTSYGLEPPTSPEILHFKFDLFCCPLIHDETVDMMNDVAKLIPAQPNFEKLSTQSVEIHRATSGMHAYYPVRFEKKYFIELDAMFHVCVTAIRYKDICINDLILDTMLPKPLLDPILETSECNSSKPDSLSRSLFQDFLALPGGEGETDG